MIGGVMTRWGLTPSLMTGAVLLVLLCAPPGLGRSVAAAPVLAGASAESTPPLLGPDAATDVLGAPASLPVGQRAHLAHHPKLLAAATVLAPFDQGLATTGVIVNLKPPAAAEALAAQSRLSPRFPLESEQRTDTRYYDLLDEHIRGPLRDSINDTLDQVRPSLDHTGLTHIQPFAYQYGFAARVTAAALSILLDHPAIAMVEPDRPLGTAAPTPPDPEAQVQATSGPLSPPLPMVAPLVLPPTPLAAVMPLASSPASLTTGEAPATMASLITQWEALIDRLDQERDPPPPVLATGQGGPVGEGPGPCDHHLPTLAQAAANAQAAGISLFAPAGDDGDCSALPWPACLSTVNAVGAVYAADQGLAGWCVGAASCAAKGADDTCASGYLALEQALTDQVPAYSNSTDDLTLLAPATPDLSGTEGTQAATAATLAAASAMQELAWERSRVYLSPSEVHRLLTESGSPITDAKSGLTTPRLDLGLALEATADLIGDSSAGPPGHGGATTSNPVHSPRSDHSASPAAISATALATESLVPETTSASCPLDEELDEDLDLPDLDIIHYQLFRACQTLAAGPFSIGSAGKVTFEAGQRITLRPGFRVALGGALTARITGEFTPKPVPLNDTGINKCANATENNLTCPVSDFPGQDAQYGRDVTDNNDSNGHAGFKFTKISNSGNRLEVSATLGSERGDWGCTCDNVTGLMWEVKTTPKTDDIKDRGLRDMGWTYSWYNPNAATNGTDKFVEDVNKEGLCGFFDWRLPNRFELESITSNDRTKPAIDTNFFPNTVSGFFWSSSPTAYDNLHAWGVNFDTGAVGYYLKSSAHYVRLVRDGHCPDLVERK